MRILLIATALASFAMYGAAMKYLFPRPTGVHPKMRVLTVLGFVFAAFHIYSLATAHLRTRLAVPGFFAYMLGIALFLWSVTTIRGMTVPLAYSQSTPATVVKNGPYRLVRHPFYLLTQVRGLPVQLAVEVSHFCARVS
jgi:protein-S-isoprenylcysteine O-methyltransferase Ste14